MNLLVPPTAPTLGEDANYWDPRRPIESANRQFAASQAYYARQVKYEADQAKYTAGMREMTRRMGDIGRQEVDEVSAANSNSANTLNMAAMAAARRRAGGVAFRRRGSGVSANQLTSGLGAVTAKARADQRRAIAKSEVEAGVGWAEPYEAAAQRAATGGFTLGAPAFTIYH